MTTQPPTPVLRVLTALLLMLCFVGAFGQTSASNAVQTPKEAAQWVQSRLDAYVDSATQGKTTAGQYQWNYAVLFNSAQVSSHSAYGEFCHSLISFMLNNAEANDPGALFSFYPYQLDVYTGPSQSIQSTPINDAVVQSLSRVFPTVPLSTLPTAKPHTRPRAVTITSMLEISCCIN